MVPYLALLLTKIDSLEGGESGRRFSKIQVFLAVRMNRYDMAFKR
jgi:hypothetical protein